MKKYIFTAALTAASLFSLLSCNKEIDTVAASTSNGPSIECYTPDDSKNYVDVKSVKWNENEAIYVTPADAKEYKIYTLTEGAGTTTGIFKYSSTSGTGYSTGTDIVAFTQGPSTANWFSGGDWFIDIPRSLTFSQTLTGTMIPMVATGTVGSPLKFEHLVSMVSLQIYNPSDASIVITDVQLRTDSKFATRINIDHPNTDCYQYYSGVENIAISGNLEIAAKESETLYVVVYNKTYTNFGISVLTSDGVVYDFVRSSFDAKKGYMHKFIASLDDSHKEGNKYSISIDGGTAQPYVPSSGFPGAAVPAESIKIISNSIIKPTQTEISAMASSVESLTSCISVDFSEMTSVGDTWNYYFTTSKVSDLYYPSTVVKTSGYGHFRNSPNIKLHISKNLTNLDLITLKYDYATIATNSGCGFFVDEDNTTYKSLNCWLYLYYTGETPKVLYQTPQLSGDIIIPEGVTELLAYAISHNPLVTSVTLPSTLTKIGNCNFYVLTKIKAIFCKSITPPSIVNFSCPSTGGYVVIDTGNDTDDETGKASYTEAWGTMVSAKNWQIVTRAEYDEIVNPVITGSNADIDDLNEDKDSYSENLW